MDPTIKPCPFCGGKAKLVDHIWITSNGRVLRHPYTKPSYVYCTECKTSSGRVFPDWEKEINVPWYASDEFEKEHAAEIIEKYNQADALAVENWNRRTE